MSELEEENDFKLVAGHIALFLGKHDLAEKCYLESSSTYWALSMRRDLCQWDDALNLANHYNSEMCADICLSYAQAEEDA